VVTEVTAAPVEAEVVVRLVAVVDAPGVVEREAVLLLPLELMVMEGEGCEKEPRQ
jgi:hypothetical protein